MENLNIQFGQIPFWAICGFGKRSKIEIVVFSAICAKWFRSSETADISRQEIIEITGLDKSQVSTAIKKLSKIGWIIQHSKTRWFIPANKQEKVDDLSTNLDTEKVDELTTTVDDFSTKVDDSSTLYKETDLQTKQTIKKTVVKKQASRIPSDFRVTDAMLAWAKEHAPHISTSLETANFVDYWQAKSGKNAVKLDWEATWRTWFRNSEKWYLEKHGNSYPTSFEQKPALRSESKYKTTEEIKAEKLAIQQPIEIIKPKKELINA